MAASGKCFLVSDFGEKTEVFHDAVVGRTSSCQLELGDATVSRQHARFIVSEGRFSLKDLDSRNGTFIKGVLINEASLLQHGDSIRFGSYSCTFEMEQALDAESGEDVTIVAPEGLADVQEDSLAGQGAVLVMPRFKNLPPSWFYTDDDAHTSFLSPADVQKLAQEQEQVSFDLSVLEASIDAPTLVIASGSESGTPYKLQKASVESFWTIGSGAENLDISIIIDDVSVSMLHAKLSCKGGRWKIADQMSTNKTYVNGEQFNTAFLSSKDVIRLGAVSLLFLLPEKLESEQVSAQSRKSLLDKLKHFFKP